RGLKPNALWQMDVTHVAEFGKLKYGHVSIDTYSHYIWATAQSGEKTLHVERHLLESFAVMGVPQEIKTDNAPAYISKRLTAFFQLWGVKHSTGIPHSPTGQAIVE
ncbi:POK19 protein, partial [Syrrhaptes paradoxus]|nr:POK19 protein [Syrrhaptes paradoxus]